MIVIIQTGKFIAFSWSYKKNLKTTVKSKVVNYLIGIISMKPPLKNCN